MKNKRFEKLEHATTEVTSTTQRNLVQRLLRVKRRLETHHEAHIDTPPTPTPEPMPPAIEKAEKPDEPRMEERRKSPQAAAPREGERRQNNLPHDEAKMLSYAKKMPELLHHMKREGDRSRLRAARMRVVNALVGVGIGLALILYQIPTLVQLKSLGLLLLFSFVWYLTRTFQK